MSRRRYVVTCEVASCDNWLLEDFRELTDLTLADAALVFLCLRWTGVPFTIRRDHDTSGRTRGMTAPQRIQRKRTKGWRMPEGAIYVGRPTVFGNPIRVPSPPTRTGRLLAKGFYQVKLMEAIEATPAMLDEIRTALAGRDLACWCALDAPCHADVLLKLANS